MIERQKYQAYSYCLRIHYTLFICMSKGISYHTVCRALSFAFHIVRRILYVVYFFSLPCYASIVPGKQTTISKRKEANPMKKLEKLVKAFYESFSHREG